MSSREPDWLKEAGKKVDYKIKLGRPARVEYRKASEPKWLKEAGEPLEKMKYVELVALAKKNNITGYSGKKKTAIINLIKLVMK